MESASKDASSRQACCGRVGCDRCKTAQNVAIKLNRKSTGVDKNQIVLIWQAKRCQGHGEWWSSIVFVMPSLPIKYVFPDHVMSYVNASPAESPLTRSDEPDEPVAWL
jgi:hypothetical protein